MGNISLSSRKCHLLIEICGCSCFKAELKHQWRNMTRQHMSLNTTLMLRKESQHVQQYISSQLGGVGWGGVGGMHIDIKFMHRSCDGAQLQPAHLEALFLISSVLRNSWWISSPPGGPAAAEPFNYLIDLSPRRSPSASITQGVSVELRSSPSQASRAQNNAFQNTNKPAFSK